MTNRIRGCYIALERGWPLLAVSLLAACQSDSMAPVGDDSDLEPPTGEPVGVLVGAGDIGRCGRLAPELTARILDTIPGTVFTTGDNAYPDGTAENFAECYDPSWGRHKARTRPTPGNHDYHTPGAAAYFEYFGANAGDPSAGYYSYDIGNWHVIALNSEADMDADSPQEQWLRADLAASTSSCTIAYWHHPRFSSGRHGSDDGPRPLWDALYESHAEIVLNGHDHLYERFEPQTPEGAADPDHGIRQFTVGMGGTTLYDFSDPLPNSTARNNSVHGVLKLTLYQDGYQWEFVPVEGADYVDRGTGACHPQAPMSSVGPMQSPQTDGPTAFSSIREARR